MHDDALVVVQERYESPGYPIPHQGSLPRLFKPLPVIEAHPGWLARPFEDGHRLAVLHDNAEGVWFHYFGPAFVLGPAERIPA